MPGSASPSRRLSRALACLALSAMAFAMAAAAYAGPTFPPLTGRVVDEAGLLTPEDRAALKIKRSRLLSEERLDLRFGAGVSVKRP